MEQGALPKRLLKDNKPFCTARQFGKMTQRPWRVKGDDKHQSKTTTRSGQIISWDQLESSTTGFIAQLKGILTSQQYKYATVFVDQCLDLTFIFLQKRLTSEETVLMKKTFLEICISQGSMHPSLSH